MSGGTRLEVGVQLPTTDGFGVGYVDVRIFARAAEDLGFDSIWVGDHFSFPAPVIESFVAATTVAAVTERVGVGFGVLLPALRHPGWIAKQLSSLQVVSGDRVSLGVGVGGEFPAEWAALGVPLSQRGARTDEFLRVLPSLMSGATTELGEPWNATVPPLTPHGKVPPLWVGGRKDVALRRAVRNGAGWLGVWLDAAGLAERAERLSDIAGELGQPVPPIGVEILVHPTEAADGGRAEMAAFMESIYGIPFERLEPYAVGGTEEEILGKIGRLVEAGATKLVMIPAVREPAVALPSLARIADRLRSQSTNSTLQ